MDTYKGLFIPEGIESNSMTECCYYSNHYNYCDNVLCINCIFGNYTVFHEWVNSGRPTD